jgi:hypothetical protein
MGTAISIKAESRPSLLCTATGASRLTGVAEVGDIDASFCMKL